MNTERMYKTKATQCRECNGTGQVRKVRKDGTLYAKSNRCKVCNGSGYLSYSYWCCSGSTI